MFSQIISAPGRLTGVIIAVGLLPSAPASADAVRCRQAGGLVVSLLKTVSEQSVGCDRCFPVRLNPSRFDGPGRSTRARASCQ